MATHCRGGRTRAVAPRHPPVNPQAVPPAIVGGARKEDRGRPFEVVPQPVMHSRVRVAAAAWIAGVAGLALALSVTALVVGHTTSGAPMAPSFRPVVVPAASPAASAPIASPVVSPIVEADLAPPRHPTSRPPAIRAAVRTVTKPTPRPKPARTRHRSRPRPVRVPSVASARAYARARIGATQFACLDKLWTKESGWNPRAYNRSSGAYGIPQALPGSKMASIAGDWRTNPLTQVRWGLAYIGGRYGTACSAWSHSVRYDWY
jgi:hypothetical protein